MRKKSNKVIDIATDTATDITDATIGQRQRESTARFLCLNSQHPYSVSTTAHKKLPALLLHDPADILYQIHYFSTSFLKNSLLKCLEKSPPS